MSTQRNRSTAPAVVPTDWSAQRAYRCRHCGEECINHEESPEARGQQCRSCWRLPALEDSR